MKCLLKACRNIVPPSRKKSAKYCSDECYYEAKKERSNMRYAIINGPYKEVKRCENILAHLFGTQELKKSSAGIVGNNVIGFFHNLTKVKRLLEQRGAGFLPPLLDQEQPATVKGRPGTIHPVQLNRKNMDRLHDCFEHIACGLYFHKFKKVFNGECSIIMDFLTFDNKEAETFKLICRKRFEYEHVHPVGEGANPEVFRYDFVKPDKDGLIALRMVFYEGATVFVCFVPAGVKPFYLMGAFIDAGISTTIDFPDGTAFKFNERIATDTG